MKHAGIRWDAATLAPYLADPQKVVPGNRMPFPGLKSETETDRHDVVAFLAAVSAGPLPPPSVGALTTLHPMVMKRGETTRVFFGVGGPNFTSSFHIIGTILDKVYEYGGLTNPPPRGIQIVSVAPGGAVVVDFKMPVPGRYVVVDHALACMERGLSGPIIAEGRPTPDIFDAPGGVAVGGGH